MSTLTFADTHNMVSFLEKPAESDGFHEIIDFLNSNQIHYALTVNLTIYTSCIEQFWATAKANTVNGERQLQVLVDKKRVIITESNIRSDLHLDDAGGIDCLPTATIFKELARMGAKSTAWNEFALRGKGQISDATDSQQTPITTQPSSSRPQKKQSRRKPRKETEVPQDETHHDDNVPIPSNDPLLSGKDRMQLTELMILCTNLQKQVLDLDKAKDAQAKEIANLKKRVQKLERKKKSRTIGLKRLRKVGESSRVESSKDKENDLHGDEVIVDMAVGEKQEKSEKVNEREVSTGVEDSAAHTIPVTTADEGVTAAKINEITPTSAPTIVIDELTLAQTLIEIKAAKPKAVTTAATITTTRPKARRVKVQEPSEFRTTTSSPQASQPSKTKDKGKAIMIEPEVPLKRKDQVALDEEMARTS
ncbi:hypothetical protein Tco_1120956 [Tanacetum coccineum]|uniref:Xylulose kinase-1 n=1 Tax=Tanacetum coccineum TaxID=301880 RepID=A0ABQ5IWB7_9ASTR